jgi:hypothetical protein
MSDLKIIGNGHCRDIIYYWELTDDEREDLDWADEDEAFFRYKDNVYALSEFMRISKQAPEPMQAFDGYMSDSFFSGILIRYPCRNEWHTVESDEHVQVYWYMT